MSTQNPHNVEHWGVELPSVQVIAAILLIAVGGIFLAVQAGVMSYSDNWWVVFLIIPSVVFFWSAVVGYQHTHVRTGAQITEVVLGALLLLLAFIFVFDPTWSFTTNLGLDRVFPGVNWNQVWPFIVLAFGAVLVLGAIVKQWLRLGVFGVITMLVSAVFIFDIDWNYVWPIAIVLLGAWMLIAPRKAG